MIYEGMVEKILPIYYYRFGCLWDIGMLSRPILDDYCSNTLEYDDYGCRI